jgi:hypothetical protein
MSPERIMFAHAAELASIEPSTAWRSAGVRAFMRRSALRQAPSRQALTISSTPRLSPSIGAISKYLKDGS